MTADVSIAPSVFPQQGPPAFDFDAVMRQLYNDAIIFTGGDEATALQMVRALEPQVRRFGALLPRIQRGDAGAAAEALSILRRNNFDEAGINAFFRSQQVPDGMLTQIGLDPVAVNPEKAIQDLIPSITGDDPAAAARDLRRALSILRDHAGLQGPEPLYEWLAENVPNDDVLRAAGIDPEPVRAAGAPPELHPELAALIEVARTMMESMGILREGQAADAEAIAELGRAFEAFTDSVRAPPEAPAEGGVTVSGLVNIPIRV